MGGVCASQCADGKRLPSTFSQCLQKASGLRFGAPPASFAPPRLFAPGLGAPAASDRPLHVVVLGAGPVGLLFALRLVELGSRNISISVYDARLAKDEAGKLCIRHGMEDPRVFAVPRALLAAFGSSEATRRCLEGVCEAPPGEWPGVLCVSSAALQEALLLRAQEADVAHQLSLVEGLSEPLAKEDLRLWIETLTPTHVVAAEGYTAPVRQAFAEELGLAASAFVKPRAGVSPPMLVAFVTLEGSEPSPPAAAARSCAQSRFFFVEESRGKGSSRRAVLGAVLRRSAWAEIPLDSSTPVLLYDEGQSEASSALCRSRADLRQRYPKLESQLSLACSFFGLSGRLRGAALAPAPRRAAEETFVASALSFEVCFLGEGDAGDLKDAGALRPPPFWPEGNAPPPGSLTQGLEAAEGLAAILHRRAPSAAFECFAQSLRAPRTRRSEPPAKGAASLTEAIAGWRERLEASGAASTPEVLEEAEGPQLQKGHSVGSRCIPAPSETALPPWLRLLQSSVPPRRTALARVLQAWELLSQSLAQEALAALGGRETSPHRRGEQDALTLTIRAEALLRLGRYEEAAGDCMEALAIAPASCLARLVQAEVNLRVGYLTDCIEDCSFVLTVEPRCAHAATLRAEARLGLGELHEALHDCEWALMQGPRAGPVLLIRGNVHRKLGRLREAVSDADEALRQSPSCAPALVVRGQALLDLGDARAALADLSKAIELSGSLREVTASAYAARAEAFVTLKRYEEAAKDCDEALKLSDCPLALAVRGEAKLLNCEYLDALDDCNAALILNPGDPYTLAVRAEAQMCIGNLDEAIADCDQALQLSPSLEYAVMIRERACNLEVQEQQAAFRFSD